MKFNYFTTLCQVQQESVIGWIFMIVIGIAVFIGIMFLLRELFCWYWKINQMTSSQDATVLLLTKLNKKIEHQIELQQKILEAMIKTSETGGNELSK